MRAQAHPFLLACGIAMPCALVAAQSPQIVFPTQAAVVEGDTFVIDHTGGLPWWPNPDPAPNAAYCRVQLICELPGFNGTIRELRFRRDGAARAGYDTLPFLVELQMTLSTARNTAATASATFANNIGADATTVIPRGFRQLGSQPWTGSFPEEFKQLRLQFSTPFTYNSANGPLCIDVLHYSNDLMDPIRLTQGPREVDAMTNSMRGATLSSGSRCARPDPWTPNIDLHGELYIDSSGPSPKLNFYAWRQYGQHHSTGVLIGALERLPIGTGLPMTTFSPASCGSIDLKLANPPLLFTVLSSSNEYGEIRWPKNGGDLWSVPYNPAWQGLGFKFYIQELSDDVHTPDWWASSVVTTQIPTWAPQGVGMRVIYAEGPTSHTAATGTLGQLDFGPVLAFY